MCRGDYGRRKRRSKRALQVATLQRDDRYPDGQLPESVIPAGACGAATKVPERAYVWSARCGGYYTVTAMQRRDSIVFTIRASPMPLTELGRRLGRGVGMPGVRRFAR